MARKFLILHGGVILFLFASFSLAWAGNFTDNGDGTVKDSITGLIWQQEDDNTTRSWDSALSYCEGLILAGHQDWRLPNIKELKSITDMTRYNPAIDVDAFPGTNSSNYWSSTTSAFYSGGAWYVSFSIGNVYYGSNKYDAYYVRCVRGGQ